MPRMAELIAEGKAPRSMMRRAARGELSLAPGEAVEILVALAGDQELAAEAGQTLAGWDEPSLCAVAADPATLPAVLRHLLQSQVRRPAVIAALCENAALPLAELDELAAHGREETLQAMARSGRVRGSLRLLERMAQNPQAAPLRAQLEGWLASAQGNDADEAERAFLEHHAEELAREENQPFELVTGAEGEEDPLAQLLTRAKQGETEAAPEQAEQLSLLQRIARMRVGERIKLAMRGSREERMMLIRDRSKLVSLAVLASPKVNDAEMETYAAMKNLQETILRAIATNRKNMKNYGVIRTLVNNPKTPLDVALPLLAHLLIKDLRGVAINKNVNETIRKRALKMFRDKTERKKD